MIFLAVLIGGIVVWLEYKEQKNIEKQQLEDRKKELKDLGKQEQADEQLQVKQDREKQKILEENRKKRQDLVSRYSGSRSAPPSLTPVPISPTPTQTSSPHRAAVESACRSSRATLVEYQEQGNISYVVVQGPDHTSVSDILDVLLRSGMKDFTEHKDKYSLRYQNGQSIYTAAYTIKW